MRKRVIVAITGATGAPIAYRLLELMQDFDVDVHLLISKWAKKTIALESPHSIAEFEALANCHYADNDLAAAISSGSYHSDGMIIVPCSMKTVASIRHGFSDNLISRAADVVLKEQRKLLLVTRESPLNTIHLENMLALSRMGVSIFPPVPAFYNKPQNIDEMITHIAVRILDQFGLNHPQAVRWQ